MEPRRERDTTVKKVDSAHSPHGEMGQKYLASGRSLSMRKWERVVATPENEMAPTRRRDYETVGYVVEGEAELHMDGQKIRLTPGDCWVVPAGAEHTYRVVEEFTAVEATSPPAERHDRDEDPRFADD